MPFRSAKQERFMFANHPDIAKRWYQEFGNAPGMSSGQGQKHDAAGDYGKLHPSSRSRHTPFRATEKEATDEREPLSYMPGSNPGKRSLGATSGHEGLKGRDVRSAARARFRKKG